MENGMLPSSSDESVSRQREMVRPELFDYFEALRDSNIEAISTHLRDGSDPNADLGQGMTPLFIAAGTSRAACELLLDGGADVNKPSFNQFTPLLVAIGARQEAIVDLLLQRGANLNYANSFLGGITPWQMAQRQG